MPKQVTHADYGFSVFFAVPAHLAKGREVVSERWFDEPALAYQLRFRECWFDEYSDYGFLVDPPKGQGERGPTHGRTQGLLLSDALADPDGFVEVLDELPADWNFGGLIAVDRPAQLAFSTNCDVAETPEWRRILNGLASQEIVAVTFSRTDVGVRLERREGDVIVQQTAWEVPPEWGRQGRDRYPVHRFLNVARCQQKLSRVLESYDDLCRQLQQRGAPRRVIHRLEPMTSARG